MSILDGVLGYAQSAQISIANELVKPILLENELVTHAFIVGVRDMMILTMKRFILVDKTGMSGKKMHIVSFPWRIVTSWGMTTSGTFDYDRELSICVVGKNIPLVVSFPKITDIRPIVRIISNYALM